ncbi:MAG: hypothetical protein LLF82_000208 [Dehalococcoides mccartyi]|nr:hypothetical protein [Dehalococcoides mccartyi]MEA2122784.1 hypothetical protein [Dehalococcoides mccartyi]
MEYNSSLESEKRSKWQGIAATILVLISVTVSIWVIILKIISVSAL